MNIINVGHTMKYENECVAMLFFPEEKIVTYFLESKNVFEDRLALYKRLHGEIFLGEMMPLEILPEGMFNDSDRIYTELCHNMSETLVTVAITIQGKTKIRQEIVSSQEENMQENIKDEWERVMGVLMYELLSEETGVKPSWGILTGVRPVKLFRNRLDKGLSEKETGEEFASRYLVSQKKIALALKTAEKETPILREVTDNSFSLYVSVPFCPSRCSYCSFVSQSIAGKKAQELLPEYVTLLCKEIEYTALLAKRAGLNLRTVYFGGGTPTTFSAKQLETVCKSVASNFDLSNIVEYTVEAGRPDTIDKQKLEVLRDNGVDRISINPQTLNDSVLKEIGREHTAQQTIDAFKLAKEVGFKVINMDLIAGLPTDTIESFSKTVEQVLELSPENVTIHTLSIKRSSHYGEDMNDRKRALESTMQVDQMVSYAQRKLMESGMLPYYLYKQRNTVGNLENTGYCKPGCEGRYNIYIMDETQTILAVGAGAVSKLKSNRRGKLERIFNYKYPFEYISGFDEILKRKDKVEDFFEENKPV